jgi:hypothetical protein
MQPLEPAMIRRHAVLATLALASAAVALGQPAQAGGGVRLNFGGPLGTFVATPTPGYGGGSGYATAKPKTYAAKRAPVEAADRRRSKPARPVVQVRHSVPSNAAKALPLTSNDNAAPGLLSRTLAIDNLPRPEMVRVLSPTDTVVARDGDETRTTAAAPVAKAPAKVAAAQGPATCRKFIPAVGVTVTVACD